MADTANDGQPYIVQSGDTLSGIAAAHGMSLSEIEKLNPQFSSNFSLIHPGNTVHLSGGALDNLVSIDHQSGGVSPSASSSQSYTVKSGDTLSSIAAAHGMSLTEIEKLNPQFSANFSLIHPGQTVHLSGGTAEGLSDTHTATTTVSGGAPLHPPSSTTGGTSGTTTTGGPVPSGTPSSQPTTSGGSSAPVLSAPPTTQQPSNPSAGGVVVPDMDANLTVTNDFHQDSTDPGVNVQKVRVNTFGGIPVERAYEAAGETWAQFSEDNTQYKPGGTIDRGSTFEIRADNGNNTGNVLTLEHNTETGPPVDPTPPTGRPLSTTTVTASGASTTTVSPPPPSGSTGAAAPPASVAPLFDPYTGFPVYFVPVRTNCLASDVATRYGEPIKEFLADNPHLGANESGSTRIPQGSMVHIRVDAWNAKHGGQAPMPGQTADVGGAFQGLKSTGAALFRGGFLKKSKYNVGQSSDGGHSGHNPVEGGQAIPPASDPVTKAVFDKPGEKPHISATKPRG